MYNYLNNKFNNSSKKVKIEIYLLTLVLFFVFFLIIEDYNKSNTITKIQNSFKLPNQTFTGSFFDLSKELEIYAKNKKIKITKIENQKRVINIEGYSSIVNISKFIEKIENINEYSNIINLNLSKDKQTKKYIFKIEISFDKFFIKNKKADIKVKKQKNINIFKVKAIISNNVLINNKWIKQNEFINGYKLIEINKNSVVLQKNNKQINIKVFENDKYTTSIN
ncbi:hypothetical protein [Poseidonibacter sp.]|uniref:hypothetical protein n=2 Tax=Poseidonibacter sp. TaxID=2321188 RepID=UPI003C78092F